MLCRAALNACDAAVASNLVHTAVRGPGAHDELVPWYLRYRVTYCGTSTATVPRERNLLALPTLDMYLPLSKFESIQRVECTLHYGVTTICYKTLS